MFGRVPRVVPGVEAVQIGVDHIGVRARVALVPEDVRVGGVAEVPLEPLLRVPGLVSIAIDVGVYVEPARVVTEPALDVTLFRRATPRTAVGSGLDEVGVVLVDLGATVAGVRVALPVEAPSVLVVLVAAPAGAGLPGTGVRGVKPVDRAGRLRGIHDRRIHDLAHRTRRVESDQDVGRDRRSGAEEVRILRARGKRDHQKRAGDEQQRGAAYDLECVHDEAPVLHSPLWARGAARSTASRVPPRDSPLSGGIHEGSLESGRANAHPDAGFCVVRSAASCGPGRATQWQGARTCDPSNQRRPHYRPFRKFSSQLIRERGGMRSLSSPSSRRPAAKRRSPQEHSGKTVDGARLRYLRRTARLGQRGPTQAWEGFARLSP